MSSAGSDLGGEHFREWCVRLNCTEAELREAIDAVGPAVEWIAEYLAMRRRRPAFPAV
jgi:hypothetical protein